MLNLMKDGVIIRQAFTGSRLDISEIGAIIMPAYAGWTYLGYELVEAPEVNEPEEDPQLQDCLPVRHAQMAAALVMSGWITEAEGENWLDGNLPAAFLTAIAALPEAMQLVARFQAKRPSVIEPTNPLIMQLAQGKELGESDVISIFQLAASL